MALPPPPSPSSFLKISLEKQYSKKEISPSPRLQLQLPPTRCLILFSKEEFRKTILQPPPTPPRKGLRQQVTKEAVATNV